MKSGIKAVLIILAVVVASSQARATDLCEHVLKIKKMPFKDEGVDDPSYNALVKAGRAAIPCLIPMITDTRKMRDPRQSYTYGDVRAGDVAYFMLMRIANTDFRELLPPKVQKNYKTQGIYAYFEYVEQYRNRMWLRRRLQKWYQRERSRGRAAA
jgi:hypothetical protein